jgi:hypothetical protein
LPSLLRPGIVEGGASSHYQRGMPVSRKPGRSSMSDGRTVRQLNEELARKINEEALRDPQSPYANKFVGIANGAVVVVADSLDEMARRLRQIEPDSARCFGLEASRDYSEPEYIWGLR